MTVIEFETAKQNLAASGSIFPQSEHDAMMAEFERTMQEHDAGVERAVNWRDWTYGDVA